MSKESYFSRVLHLHIETRRVTNEDTQNACIIQMEFYVCGTSSDARKV